MITPIPIPDYVQRLTRWAYFRHVGLVHPTHFMKELN